MKKLIVFILVLCFGFTTYAEDIEEPTEIYAQSAVLMDAESGRVLFEKNGTDRKAMASTTKIMTCIIALEKGNLEEVVTFSKEAASQPKVHLGASLNEQFYLEDLLYSLMLESHNDSAVAIAESVSGSVEAFAQNMNQKAKEIGCENSYFITPNGLDASDDGGVHSTTAVDLARIMSYCITKSPQKEKFLEITQTSDYSFSNLEGNKSYSCYNHNTFLSMMPEAISGKTGYTSDAGYCYVGAVESEGRTFVVSLLACGWPNNKNYKWSDMRKIVEYAMEAYHYKTIDTFPDTENAIILNGIPKSNELFEEAKVSTKIDDQNEKIVCLVKDSEEIHYLIEQKETLEAPVMQGYKIGEIIYYLDEEEIASYPIRIQETIEEKEFAWYFLKVCEKYIMKN